MNKYEVAVVISAKLEDDERSAVLDKVKALIERFNGTVTEIEDAGKKKLAYEIQKQKEAFYYFVQFESDSDCPNEVEKRIRIMDSVLRYLIVAKEA